MILVGGGDFYIIKKILSKRPKSKEVLFCGHLYELGAAAFEKV